MKYDLINIIVCPKCRSALKVNVALEKNIGPYKEIIEGCIVCKEGHSYSLTKGVPVLLSELDKGNLRAMQIFGFEWKKFAGYSIKNLPDFLYPLTKDIFLEKKVLDSGCGAGRHIVEIADSGAKVIVGLDISQATEIAYDKIRNLSQAHIIQADICRLPFITGYFDFIYSFGVLHHLPSPFEAFKCLTKILAPNGTILICVYKKTLRKELLGFIRLFTKNLPPPIQIVLAFFCTIFDRFFLIEPYVFISKIPFIKRILERCTSDHIIEYAKYGFRENFTDWYDRLSAPIAFSYTEQEIKKWFSDTNLSCIEVSSIGSFWVRGYGKKP